MATDKTRVAAASAIGVLKGGSPVGHGEETAETP
jgi:hypothetical protein